MADLSGELTFARALAVLDAARPGIGTGSGPVELNLAQVTRVDSAGLALLLELVRTARGAGRELRCVQAPEQLRRLAEFFGLSQLLGLTA